MGSLESYFAIHAELSKNLSNQINTDIITTLFNYVKDEKELIVKIELSGRKTEKDLNLVMETYNKVYL